MIRRPEVIFALRFINEPRHEKTSAQSNQHLCCSLLDSIISLVSISVLYFKPLAIFYGCAGQFVSYLVANPEDRFSRDEAQILVH